MNHLSHEEVVLTYYGEPSVSEDRRTHLEACDVCRNELAALAAVLDRVTPLEVPEPGDDYESRVWNRLQWRLRGEQRKRRPIAAWIAVAATIAIAFLAGVLWKSSSRPVDQSTTIAATDTSKTRRPEDSKTAAKPAAEPNRILLVVVGEHFDESERVLVELTNLTPEGENDISGARDRAQELLTSNRLYRTSATTRGEDDVATLLDELEPVLLQLAHAPDQVSGEELRRMQKRVESKGLVFKLRVVRAGVARESRTTPSTSI
ncbi:MAG TPA: hypothetical protein VND45_09760 [Thermoanaerobaculia bacterium]|jgi:hypothetical protein|nr:hypothetical protein [Thermoanaerobaculia bacterium]